MLNNCHKKVHKLRPVRWVTFLTIKCRIDSKCIFLFSIKEKHISEQIQIIDDMTAKRLDPVNQRILTSIRFLKPIFTSHKIRLRERERERE